MLETMYKAPGIGLAAVQVGVPLRAVVIDISRDEEKNPLLFINPKITWRSEETSIYEEGCLSIPNQFAEIESVQKKQTKPPETKAKTGTI